MCLFPAGLGDLDLAVFGLETASLLFGREHFLDKSLLAIFLHNARLEELSWTFDDRANLGILGYTITALLFVVSVGIQDITHS